MRKLLSLLIVLVMLFVAGPALADTAVGGDAYRWTELYQGWHPYLLPEASGFNDSYGSYEGTIAGFAKADGGVDVKAWKGYHTGNAKALTWSTSSAGVVGPGVAKVEGFGVAAHYTTFQSQFPTTLPPADQLITSGGWTTGYAAYSYKDRDRSRDDDCLYTSGGGLAYTEGGVSRSTTFYHSGRMAESHAWSVSFAISTGGGSIPTN